MYGRYKVITQVLNLRIIFNRYSDAMKTIKLNLPTYGSLKVPHRPHYSLSLSKIYVPTMHSTFYLGGNSCSLNIKNTTTLSKLICTVVAFH